MVGERAQTAINIRPLSRLALVLGAFACILYGGLILHPAEEKAITDFWFWVTCALELILISEIFPWKDKMEENNR